MTHAFFGRRYLEAGDHAAAEPHLLDAYRVARYSFPAADEMEEVRALVIRLYSETDRPDEATRFESADYTPPPRDDAADG